MTTLATLTFLALTLWGALGLLADHRADRRLTADGSAASLPGRPPRRVEAGVISAPQRKPL